MPTGKIFSIRQAGKKSFHVVVCLCVLRDGVVDVVRRLPPGIENDFLVGMIGMQHGNDTLDRIVKEDRAYAHHYAEFKAVITEEGTVWPMAFAEEGFVLADRLALVVEDGPAAADPARINNRPVFDERPWLGVNFFLDLSAKSVRIGKTDLNPGFLVLR